MKAKDLKILRKKLTKANRSENNPLDSFSKDALAFKVLRHPEKDAAVEKAAEKVLSVKFLSSSGLSEIEFQEVLFLFERNMGELYKSSSWGLNMDEKALELKHDKARFLLLKTEDDKLAGFLCFRFVYDDDEYPTQAVVYVYECQIDELYRRQGIGKKIMGIAEKITSEAEMTKVMLTVFKKNKEAIDFYKSIDYSIDESSPSMFDEPADYEILSRLVNALKT